MPVRLTLDRVAVAVAVAGGAAEAGRVSGRRGLPKTVCERARAQTFGACSPGGSLGTRG